MDQLRGAPAAAELDEIARGVALYPRNTDLAYNAAVLCLQCGLDSQASALIDKALVFAADPRKREYLRQLRPAPDGATVPNPSNAAVAPHSDDEK